MENAIKLNNAEMKALLEGQAVFRGPLQMLAPAKLFGPQRWVDRFCVVAPRQPFLSPPVSQ